MCDAVLSKYVCVVLCIIDKQICKSCMICQWINKALWKQSSGGKEPGLQPFQSVQVNLTELPKVGRFKYLLVLIDHLSGWVEAFPSISATAHVVTKIILEQIIPWYRIVENIDSDQGSHFTSHILQKLVETLRDKMGVSYSMASFLLWKDEMDESDIKETPAKTGFGN